MLHVAWPFCPLQRGSTPHQIPLRPLTQTVTARRSFQAKGLTLLTGTSRFCPLALRRFRAFEPPAPLLRWFLKSLRPTYLTDDSLDGRILREIPLERANWSSLLRTFTWFSTICFKRLPSHPSMRLTSWRAWGPPLSPLRLRLI